MGFGKKTVFILYYKYSIDDFSLGYKSRFKCVTEEKTNVRSK